MSKVDWSLAPEGATHYTYGSPDPWRDYSTNTAMYWSTIRKEWSKMCLRSSADCLNSDVPHEARPQPKPWSGPEDGLPQVNTECEVVEGPAHWDDRDAEWLGTNVKVRSSFINDLGQSIVAVERFDGRCSCFIIECLAVTKTPEQQVAEQRETAIREIMDVADVDCRVTAARLVDAGFKREVV